MEVKVWHTIVVLSNTALSRTINYQSNCILPINNYSTNMGNFKTYIHVHQDEIQNENYLN